MRISKLLLIAFLIASAQVTLAQDAVECRDNETYSTCFSRIANAAGETDPKDPQSAAPATVAAMNTGDNEQSTTNDFLPLLRLLLNDDGTSDENRKIGFEWSPRLSKSFPSKITLTLQDSDLYEPIDKALKAADLADQVDTLGKKIDAGDDITFAFTLSKASKTFGRDPDQQDELLGALVDRAREDASPELKAIRKQMGDFRRNHGTVVKPNSTFGSIDNAALRDEYRRIAQLEIPLEVEHLKGLVARLDALGFYGLLDLVDNQPQFTFTATYESRGELVGPDDLKATLALEFGGRNVNSFRKYAHASHECPDHVDGDDLESEIACLAEYIGGAESSAESFRVKVAAEYSKLQRYEFELADPAFSYVEKPVDHLSISAAMSRQFGLGGKGLPRSRLDAKVSYEDFSDDPSRQDRGIATVTFSYPIAQGFFVTLGAVYATRPEFRGDVDEEISTRLGFTYKLIQDK